MVNAARDMAAAPPPVITVAMELAVPDIRSPVDEAISVTARVDVDRPSMSIFLFVVSI